MKSVSRLLLRTKSCVALLVAAFFWNACGLALGQIAAEMEDPVANDSHFHLTNYIQEGTDIHDFVKIMGNKIGRVALFGIPLQQQWSYRTRVTPLLRITYRLILRSIITLSQMRTSPWRTDRSPRKSRTV